MLENGKGFYRRFLSEEICEGLLLLRENFKGFESGRGFFRNAVLPLDIKKRKC
jgi:hypothetical protein